MFAFARAVVVIICARKASSRHTSRRVRPIIMTRDRSLPFRAQEKSSSALHDDEYSHMRRLQCVRLLCENQREDEIARSQNTPHFSRKGEFTHAYRSVSLSRVFSDDLSLDSEKERRIPFSPFSAPGSRGCLPQTSGTRACSRAEGNGPAFNVNRHARLIRRRKERKRRKAEGESGGDSSQTSE